MHKFYAMQQIWAVNLDHFGLDRTAGRAQLLSMTHPTSVAQSAHPHAAPGMYQADVAIVGAGLVGSTLALLLADNGFEVALLDREKTGQNLDAGFDGRASAIAQATHRVLKAAGLWSDLDPLAAPIQDIRVADGQSPLFLHYDSEEVGTPFGFMLENRHMRQALYRRQSQHPAIHDFSGASVTGLDGTAGAGFVHLDDQRTVQAPLIIGADGRGSLTRKLAGIDVKGWLYDQQAIVCTIEHEAPHGYVAHEHFLPAGPFAILPIVGDPARPGHQSSLVWTEKTDLVSGFMALSDREFLMEVALRFGDFLGPISLVGPRFSYPLGLQFATRATGERVCLVGDALHGMHPIAGQGFNMGLRDVAALVEVLEDARQAGLDLGGADVLERYERWRRFDNSLMLATTDVLNRLFSNDIAPIQLARDVGLALVNETRDVKRFFMRHAMGEVGDLPKLMQNDAAGT